MEHFINDCNKKQPFASIDAKDGYSYISFSKYKVNIRIGNNKICEIMEKDTVIPFRQGCSFGQPLFQ